MAHCVAYLLLNNLLKNYPPSKAVWHRQPGNVQTILHSHIHTVGEEDLQTIRPPQAQPTALKLADWLITLHSATSFASC